MLVLHLHPNAYFLQKTDEANLNYKHVNSLNPNTGWNHRSYDIQLGRSLVVNRFGFERPNSLWNNQKYSRLHQYHQFSRVDIIGHIEITVEILFG